MISFRNGCNSWPLPSTPEEHRAVAAMTFRDAETRLLADPDTLTAHLLLVAWRLTREIARVRDGLLKADKEPLAAIPLDLWRVTDQERSLPEPQPSRTDPAAHAKHLAYTVPLALETQEHVDNATPLLELVAFYLEIPTRGPQRAAMNLLLAHPEDYWPDQHALTAYDSEFIQATGRKLLKKSRPMVSRALQHTYGLLPHEAKNLTLAAMGEFKFLTTGDKEAEKGLMLAKLEDFAHRMREAMHPREEIHALKTIATIQGLTKPEVPEEEEDLTDVIARVAAEDLPTS